MLRGFSWISMNCGSSEMYTSLHLLDVAPHFRRLLGCTGVLLNSSGSDHRMQPDLIKMNSWAGWMIYYGSTLVERYVKATE